MEKNVFNYSFIQRLFLEGLQCAKPCFRCRNATVRDIGRPAPMRDTFSWGHRQQKRKQRSRQGSLDSNGCYVKLTGWCDSEWLQGWGLVKMEWKPTCELRSERQKQQKCKEPVSRHRGPDARKSSENSGNRKRTWVGASRIRGEWGGMESQAAAAPWKPLFTQLRGVDFIPHDPSCVLTCGEKSERRETSEEMWGDGSLKWMDCYRVLS